MSLTPEEMKLHRQLISAFNDYIKHNLRWEEKGYTREAVRTRAALRKVIDLAYLRWKEVHNARKGLPEDLSIAPEFFRELSKKHKKPNRKDEEDSND